MPATERITTPGAWQLVIEELHHKAALQHRYVYVLSPAEVEEAVQSGMRLAYAGEAVRAFNYRLQGIDLAAHGAADVRDLLLARP
jgi:hypothetical protein